MRAGQPALPAPQEERLCLLVLIGVRADGTAKFPKAVAKITGDIEVLLAFYDFPAEHSRATTTVLVLTP